MHGHRNRSRRPGGCRTNKLSNKNFYVHFVSTYQQAARNVGYLMLTIHRRVLQFSQDPLVGWGVGGIWAVDSQEIIENNA